MTAGGRARDGAGTPTTTCNAWTVSTGVSAGDASLDGAWLPAPAATALLSARASPGPGACRKTRPPRSSGARQAVFRSRQPAAPRRRIMLSYSARVFTLPS